MEKKTEKIGLRVISLGIAIFLLVVLYCLYYLILDRNLASIFDEGFFYYGIHNYGQIPVTNQSLSLGGSVIIALFPKAVNYDVLQLRQIAFLCTVASVVAVLLSSLYYFKIKIQRFNVLQIMSVAVLVLLAGLVVLPYRVLNGDNLLLLFSMLSLSVILIEMSLTRSQGVTKYFLFALAAFFAFFAVLCNPAGGSVFTLILFVFLSVYDGFSLKKALKIAAAFVAGCVVGICVMHFFVLPIDKMFAFFYGAVSKTAGPRSSSHHSLIGVCMTVLFSIRDMMMGMCALCGVTYLTKLIKKVTCKDWIAVVFEVFMIAVLWKYMVKPSMCLVTFFSYAFFMAIVSLKSRNEIDKNKLVFILFLYMLPLGLSFGTNTSVMDKALFFLLPWGILMWYVLYINKGYLRQYVAPIMIFITVAMILASGIQWKMRHIISPKNDYQLEYESPVSSMKLTKYQYDFYTEVHDKLVENGFEIYKDTLLGFCFNEMTIAAMDAIPYSDDQQPEEFLCHDEEKLFRPSYMIMSEWDTIVLNKHFRQLDWNFPDSYERYCVRSNPDPNSGLRMTQSVLYYSK